MEQGSPEWFAARTGKVTASKVVDVMAKTKSGWGASRATYAAQLVAERLTGSKAEGYTNAEMQHGIDSEPQARSMYSFITDNELTEVGFIDHPSVAMSGASPDGLVGDDGLVEIKCPNTSTHIDTLQGKAIPKKYMLQMQWQMACTETQWCDFVSFDPRLPAELQIHIQRVKRDPALIAELESQITIFLAEVQRTVDTLTKMYLSNEEAA